MVENDILQRMPYQELPVRYEYRLTEKGRDLYPFMLAVWAWETRWSHESHIPPTLTHITCGEQMRPVFRCHQCHTKVHMRGVSFNSDDVDRGAVPPPTRSQRRSRSADVSDAGVDRRFFHVLDIVGDRWTGLVIAACYFGLKRYDEIALALGIATNILADRLKLLVSVDVLERIPYQKKPLRYEYKITEKGAALYNTTLQLHHWAVRNLVAAGEQPLILMHRPCGTLLKTELVCGHCEEALNAAQVTYDPVYE